MEGYTDIENKIRELDILDVNTVIEDQTKDTDVSMKQDAKNIIRLYISGIDTRALTKILREKGTMNGMITTKRMPILRSPSAG